MLDRSNDPPATHSPAKILIYCTDTVEATYSSQQLEKYFILD